MANSTHIDTAKIYQFPVGRRPSRRERNFEAAVVITDRRFERTPVIIYDGWYHEEAINADRTPNS